MKKLSLIMAVMIGLYLSVAAQHYQVHTTEAGQLADKLTGRGDNLISALFVEGPINLADFMTMRDYCYDHGLSQIDLSRAKIEGGIVPTEAFYDASRNNASCLRLIVLPENVTEIGNKAFYKNSSLYYINFPEELVKIGDEALAYTRIGFAQISGNCLDLGEGLFLETSVTEIILPERLKEIPSRFADGAAALMKVHIPESVEKIGKRSFAWCQNLSYLKIPEGVQEIGQEAFYECASITDIDLPSTLTSLRSYSLMISKFDIRHMICRAEIPPVCEIIMESPAQTDPNHAITPFFDDTATGLCISPDTPIYIPTGSAEAYRQAPGWGYFHNFIETDNFNEAATGNY